MIAHRLSTVHDADLMLVLDHGRVVQRGSHDELVRQEGLYRQLHEMQTRQGRRATRSNFTDSFVRQN
jgi:ATP-binding cassette subfamily B protein